jgi:hypothetical protein
MRVALATSEKWQASRTTPTGSEESPIVDDGVEEADEIRNRGLETILVLSGVCWADPVFLVKR